MGRNEPSEEGRSCDEGVNASDVEPSVEVGEGPGTSRSAGARGNAAGVPDDEPPASEPDSPKATKGGKGPRRLLWALLGIVVLAGLGAGGYYALYHDWSPATCTEPAICAICGKAQGEALGHDWEAASCTTPKTCRRCGETQGKVLGHDVSAWTSEKEPSCTEEGRRSGVCTRCGVTVSESVPMVEHAPGDWQLTQDVTLSTYGEVKPGTESRLCTACGKTLETREYMVEVSAQLANACRQAMQKIRSDHPSYKGLMRQLYEYEGFTEDEAAFAADHCGADWNEQARLCAEDKMRYQGYSRSGLIEELVSYERFTSEQANYAADQMGL